MFIEPNRVPVRGGGDPSALWEDVQALAALAPRWLPPPPTEFP